MALILNPFTGKLDFVRPSGGVGEETDPIFSNWLATNPLGSCVPYSGATQDVDLGEFNLINYVKMTYDPVIGAYLTE